VVLDPGQSGGDFTHEIQLGRSNIGKVIAAKVLFVVMYDVVNVLSSQGKTLHCHPINRVSQEL
jgi:hypothetical protein